MRRSTVLVTGMVLTLPPNIHASTDDMEAALHFMLRRAIGNSADTEQAFAGCVECPAPLNKKRGLQAVREAAGADSDRFVRAEAGFALWDMQVRENDLAGARATATMLVGDFPGNPDLKRYLAGPAAAAPRVTRQ